MVMWRRNKELEVLPWYRRSGYKGNLTEAQKRKLDAFRMAPSHPAATFDDLPEEVQSYISSLQIELYDKKQESLASRTFGVSAVGLAWLCISYFGFPVPTIWTYIFGAVLLAAPWVIYPLEWKRNADEFLPKRVEPDALSATNENIRTEWELNYIVDADVKDRG
ncbi:hypothetical protein LJR098_001055 [Rhizobium sp. LjRoot98]|uniref:hypothetical protein n=1 Tax=Rhizobium sp. LjRoot98 TaxID=3342345 RepID=UPI003ECFAC65